MLHDHIMFIYINVLIQIQQLLMIGLIARGKVQAPSTRHLLSTSAPAQHLSTCSAPQHLLSTCSAPVQHLWVL
jgi:hypothetical protein